MTGNRAGQADSNCVVGPRTRSGVATPPAVETLADELRQVGLAAGLDAVGVAPATPFVETRQHLEERRAAGLHGGMAFTYRNPARSTTPARILPEARAIVVGARRYPSRRPARPSAETGRPVGVVARYASDDYYRPLRLGLDAVASRLRQAHRAGLGWYGKNTNLLLPGQGSWFVLGSVVTDAPLRAADQVVADGCGACRRCLPACPTGALVAPGVLDARRCLAWLLQAPGIFPTNYRVALGGRIYGCDDCQEACPENSGDKRPGGSGRDPGPADQVMVDLVEMLVANDEDLLARFGRWYIPQRQPRYLRRNALVALGNIGDGRDRRVSDALRRCLADPDPLIRAHAVWAAARLDRRDLLVDLGEDPDLDVRHELDRVAGDLT